MPKMHAEKKQAAIVRWWSGLSPKGKRIACICAGWLLTAAVIAPDTGITVPVFLCTGYSHSRSGQVRIPGLLKGLYVPGQGLLPKYAGGHYRLADGKTEMIVSRGLCKNSLPRIFNPPEVVVIDILPRELN